MARRCGHIILIKHAPFPGNPDCLVTGRLVSQARKITADRGDFCLDLVDSGTRLARRSGTAATALPGRAAAPQLPKVANNGVSSWQRLALLTASMAIGQFGFARPIC